ncbi:MAG: S9 family peptidase [Ignavibacteriae bacterium HGW-Ignavibacteriae-3]|nr:MAG: S9 family peptidase [Ignavibacteriae bacterium HGW-Ignavibacteriae-3]
MKNIRFLLLILFIYTSQIISQDKLLTVEDVVSGFRLAPSNLRQLNFIPNTNSFAWIDGAGEKSALLASSEKSPKVDTLFKVAELNSFIVKQGEKSFNSFPAISWTSADEYNFWSGLNYYSFNLKYKKLLKLNSIPENAQNIEISPNSKFIAYTIDNNLYVSLSEKKNVQITADKNTDIINGQSVHRNEFGINGGIFWSPNSNYIAFYRMDQSMVTDYPVVDLTTTPARVNNIKYPMAGQTSHHVTIGIYNIISGNTLWLKTGEPLDQYLTSLTWSPDEKNFFIAHLNRDQNHMQLKKYDVSTGDVVKILFEERNEKYVEPQNPLKFLPNSNDKFIWQSQRNGYNHLYLYDTDGNIQRQITDGKWVVIKLNSFDTSGKYVFINSTKETPLERHYYRVNIENGKMERLTAEPGVHNVLSNSSSNYFIDSYTNSSSPRVINLIDKKGVVIRNLLTSENPLKDYKIGATKIFSIRNDEGVELFCRIITPPDFDASKKYPVIFYVYGGPHAQEVTNAFGSGKYFNWFYMMAQKGYIVFSLDNRGSANRGLEFEQATFRRLGTVEIKDQLAGVNYLKSLPYVDADRFGVYGWSYGGFMTTSLMVRTNNTFKIGACGGAVLDWKFYEVMYGERYMDTPEANPEGYKESSLLNYAENLKGKLLLVHGTSDPTVVWQNTLSFAKRCSELNRPLDYYPYIGQGHGVGGKDALHLYTKITNYFIDNL